MEAQDIHDPHGGQQEGVRREEAEPDLRAELQLGGLCDVARDHEPHDEPRLEAPLCQDMMIIRMTIKKDYSCVGSIAYCKRTLYCIKLYCKTKGQGGHEEAEVDLSSTSTSKFPMALVLIQLSNSAVITSSIGKQAIQI